MSVENIEELQYKAVENARKKCIQTYGAGVMVEKMYPINVTSKSLTCPAYWDSVACWPPTPADSLATQSCPVYIYGVYPSNNASRQCMENGVWFINKTKNVFWANYTTCFTEPETVLNITKREIPTELQEYTPLLNLTSELGYTISLSTLIIAFAIMLFMKKLHCARNILHLHLFASLIMQAFLFLLIKITLIDEHALPSDLYERGCTYFDVNSGTNNWACKLIIILMQYFSTANYSWLLMEGLYLHNLICRGHLDFSNTIKRYIILGWGLPFTVIAIWVTARLLIEDTLWWTTQEDTVPFLIVAVTTMVSILINFVLFIRISIVLHSPINEESRRYSPENSPGNNSGLGQWLFPELYRRWVKSTLVLVLLFGIHYGIFLSFCSCITTNRFVEVVWLFSNRIFTSFQGFFVAIVFCFLNGEVQSEIQLPVYKVLTSWRLISAPSTSSFIGKKSSDQL